MTTSKRLQFGIFEAPNAASFEEELRLIRRPPHSSDRPAHQHGAGRTTATIPRYHQKDQRSHARHDRAWRPVG